MTLSTLVQLGGGRTDGVAAAFDAAALQAGARGFILAATKLDLNRGEVARIIRAEMHDCIEQVGRAVASNACDLLLAGGEGMRLPSVAAEMLSVLPVPASRLVNLDTYVNHTAAEAFGQLAPPATAALLPALATAFDRRHLLEASGLGARSLQLIALAPPEPRADQRMLEGPPTQTTPREPVARQPRPPAARLGAVPAKGT